VLEFLERAFPLPHLCQAPTDLHAAATDSTSRWRRALYKGLGV
jgi:hypothetical protein